MIFRALIKKMLSTSSFPDLLPNTTIASEVLFVGGGEWRESLADLSMIFLMQQRKNRVQ